MKKYAFNQVEVLMLEHRIGETFKNRIWDSFTSVTKELGFKLRVTGGNFLTHEINGNYDDFIALQELAKQNT